MFLEHKIIIDGYEPPPVSESGYSVTPNKIWSSNTARSATGKMHGDIVAIKNTIICSWETMKQADVAELSKVVNSKPFFTVYYYDEKNTYLSGTFYCADITYSLQKVLKNDKIYENVEVELIEQ